jgi:hypothetical protein
MYIFEKNYLKKKKLKNDKCSGSICLDLFIKNKHVFSQIKCIFRETSKRTGQGKYQKQHLLVGKT